LQLKAPTLLLFHIFYMLWDEVDVKPTLVDNGGSLFSKAVDQSEKLA